jgi:hypothetical protein
MGKKDRTKRKQAGHAKRRTRGGGEADETAATYVSSRGILKSCDVKPSNISSSTGEASIDTSTVKDGSVVYVHGSAIPNFMTKLDSIKGKFILVSGDCDETIPDAVLPSEDEFNKFIGSDKIIHWFSQNAVKDHEKLTRIPIGLDYHTRPNPLEQEKELIAIKNAAKPLSERKIQCYSNFHFNKQPAKKYASDRDAAINGVPKDLVYYEPTQVPRKDTWTHQSEYAFVLSPHGGGLDCHRTWEALCLGCITVVKTSGLDKLFDELPVLIVKDWPDVTKDLLQKTVESFAQKKFNYDRLNLAYWMGLIRSKASTTGGRRSTHRSRVYKRRGRMTKQKWKKGGGEAPANTKAPKKAIVLVLNSKAGFCAIYSTLWRVYLYAKKLNLPFFIEHDNWQYTYKDGWHDYFKSLNVLNKDEHFDSIERFENGATNEVMNEFTVAEQIQAIKDTFILQDHIQQSIDSYIKDIGGDYTSLYVRRGDKINEMELISLDEILAQTNIKDDGRKLFVQSDDYSVVKDMMAKFPSCKVYTLTKEESKGASNADMIHWSPEDRKANTEELLKSCAISARATTGWTYYMSNVGNFIKLLGYNNINIYGDKKHTKEEIDKKYELGAPYKEYIK